MDMNRSWEDNNEGKTDLNERKETIFPWHMESSGMKEFSLTLCEMLLIFVLELNLILA